MFASSSRVLNKAWCSSVARRNASTLCLLRHGESQWNQENRFTGWHDVQLTEKGREEAKQAGTLLSAEGIEFDASFTSMQTRAIQTHFLAIEEMGCAWLPTTRHWRLNERHYGALTGLDKAETLEKHGAEQVLIWRRSYATPPPALDRESEYWPGHDRRYADVPDENLPLTESLALTSERMLPYWKESILPQLKDGKNILVAAHGNSLRALVAHLDNIGEDIITGLNIPTGVPLVYKFDDQCDIVPQAGGIGPLRGRYLGDQDAIRAKIEGVANQTKAKA